MRMKWEQLKIKSEKWEWSEKIEDLCKNTQTLAFLSHFSKILKFSEFFFKLYSILNQKSVKKHPSKNHQVDNNYQLLLGSSNFQRISNLKFYEKPAVKFLNRNLMDKIG